MPRGVPAAEPAVIDDGAGTARRVAADPGTGRLVILPPEKHGNVWRGGRARYRPAAAASATLPSV